MIWIIIDTALIILSLGTSTGSILLAMRINTRYGYHYLNSFMYYQILLFIFGLYGLLGTIVVRNILVEFDIPVSTVVSLAELIPFLGVPVILTSWFMFLKMSFEIVGKVVSRIGVFMYFGFIIVALFTYIVVIYLYRNDIVLDTDILTSYSRFGFIGLQIITFSIAFFVLFRYGLIMKHKHKKKMVLTFGLVSLFIVILTILLFLFIQPNSIIEKVYMVFFFAGQLPPVIVLSYFLGKYFNTVDSRQTEEMLFDKFISEYQLSKRESEIVTHICMGYTNSQISEMLFISLQTVKDHVYRIYKKTGVKNRVQLVNIVSTIGKQ